MVAALYAWLAAPRLDRQATAAMAGGLPTVLKTEQIDRRVAIVQTTAIKLLGDAVMEFTWVRNWESAHPGELGRDP